MVAKSDPEISLSINGLAARKEKNPNDKKGTDTIAEVLS